MSTDDSREKTGANIAPLKQAINLTGMGAAAGGIRVAMWGTLIGLLFLNLLIGPVAGAALGAGSGALARSLSDYGIDDQFIRSVGSTIEPGSSALFVLVCTVTADKVLPELEPFEGMVLRMSLSNKQEARLRQVLQGVKPEVETLGLRRHAGFPLRPGNVVQYDRRSPAAMRASVIPRERSQRCRQEPSLR